MDDELFFVSCNKDEDEEGAFDAVLTKVRGSECVVLYFHGGLSTEAYMKDKLGPWLRKSQFTERNLGNLCPIFITYNAGFFDGIGDKLLHAMVDFDDEIFNLVADKTGVMDALDGKKELAAKIEKAIRKKADGHKVQFALSLAESGHDERAFIGLAARALLADPGKPKTGMDAASMYIRPKDIPPGDELSDEALLKAYDNEDALKRFSANILKNESEFEEIYKETALMEEEGGLPGTTTLWWPTGFTFNAFAVIPRILIRFATGTNHEYEPTIFEELSRGIKAYGIGLAMLAQEHWSYVGRQAERCWEEGTYTHRLISELATLRKQKGDGFKISVVSHSAGSIPIGTLVKYLEDEEPGLKLDNILMIAQAINQSLFKSTVVDNCGKNYRNFRAYVLALQSERDDDVALIYRASLLYFVSGAAEKDGHGDRMLLIKQHLDRNRWPYSEAFARYMLEGKTEVWDFFDNDKSKILVYPSDNLEGSHATHECTKYPWVTQAIGKDIIRLLTGKTTDPITINTPPGAPTCT